MERHYASESELLVLLTSSHAPCSGPSPRCPALVSCPLLGFSAPAFSSLCLGLKSLFGFTSTSRQVLRTVKKSAGCV